MNDAQTSGAMTFLASLPSITTVSGVVLLAIGLLAMAAPTRDRRRSLAPLSVGAILIGVAVILVSLLI
jgi:hypothetical protein